MTKIIPFIVLTGLLAANIAAASEITGTLSNNPNYTKVATTQFPTSTSSGPTNSFDPSTAIKVGIGTLLGVEIIALVVIEVRRRHRRPWYQSAIKKEVS